MHPIGILILVILTYLVSTGTRRTALIACVAGVMYLTQGQTLNIFGIHFFAHRILGIVLFARVMLRNEFPLRNLNRIDKTVLSLYVYSAVVYLFRLTADDDLSFVAGAFDACFCYIGFRALIRTEDDLRWLLKAIVVLLVPYVLLVGIERLRGASVFLFMGGLTGGWYRDDLTRCMGSFRYPVSLGTFAATLLALYIGLWLSKTDRRYAMVGIVLCIWLVWASNSGGSLSAAMAAVVGWGFWYIRKNMRAVRWGIVVALILLAIVMKAPVWFVITHGPFAGDSWHRAYVMDVSMQNLSKWWLFGMPIQDTASWFPYTVASGGADITNQYLVFGITAGIGSIILFLLLIARAFGRVGKAVRLLDRGSNRSERVYLIWGLGVMILVHVVSWLGVSYFDQMYVIWFLELAAVVSIAEGLIKSARLARRYEPSPIGSLGAATASVGR